MANLIGICFDTERCAAFSRENELVAQFLSD